MPPLEKMQRLGRSAARVMRTRYPRFLFGRPVPHGEVPVFTYHDVTREGFSRDLRFLRENGYRTLGADEYFDAVCRGGEPRAVLLTFDDARRSFWEVALPLLQEFEARATLFVPTWWIRDEDDPDETAATSRHLFMSWQQLRLCHASGRVDVQSHGHRHALVHQSRHLVDFASPETVGRHDIYDWPMRNGRTREILGCPPLGTPIYRATPLLSAGWRLIEDPAIGEACRDVVSSGGGEAFFQRPDWQEQLRSVHGRMVASRAAAFRRMEAGEFDAQLASEFAESSRLLQAKLGVRPRFFAYPWMLGSQRSLALASRFGFEAVFGVGIDYRRAERSTSALPAFGRLKADWLRFLPGRGRLRLREVLPAKAAGFFRSQHLAH